MCHSPIIIDTQGTGFDFTDTDSGVMFDLMGTGEKVKLAWTKPGSKNGWLCLPGVGGKVDNGKELFGDITPQPPAPSPNGFAALAVYDTAKKGYIDESNAIYDKLRVWIDTNHNGVSDPDELFTLRSLGIRVIDLHYAADSVALEGGAQFRYKGDITDFAGYHDDKTIYDVWLPYVAPKARATPNGGGVRH